MIRFLILCFVVLLNGCAIVAQSFGASAATLEILHVVDVGKAVVDTVSTIDTGKSSVDHLGSYILDKDCNTLHILKGKDLCIEKDKLTLRLDLNLNGDPIVNLK